MLGRNSDLEYKWILPQPSLSAFMAPKFYLHICSYDKDIKGTAGMVRSAHHSVTLGAKEPNTAIACFTYRQKSELIDLDTDSR